MTLSKQLFIYFIIPGLFLSGIVLTSFSDLDSDGPKEIIIQIEPPTEEFNDNSKEQEEKQPESENSSGGNDNSYTAYVTGSGYARNGEAILINTPEGIKLNEKLIGQQDLEELEKLHGAAFWERIDTLTYDHYGFCLLYTSPSPRD